MFPAIALPLADFPVGSIVPVPATDAAAAVGTAKNEKIRVAEDRSFSSPSERLVEVPLEDCRVRGNLHEKDDNTKPVRPEVSSAATSSAGALEPLASEGLGVPDPCPEGATSEERDGPSLGVRSAAVILNGSEMCEAQSVEAVESWTGWGTRQTAAEKLAGSGRVRAWGGEFETVTDATCDEPTQAEDSEPRADGHKDAGGSEEEDEGGGGEERKVEGSGWISMRRASIMSCVEDGGSLTSRTFHDSFLSSSSVFFTR
jgi:hypothetical protein